MESFELVKIVAVGVIARRDGDRIVGEQESQPVPCYTLQSLVDVWHQAEQQVAQMNAGPPAEPPNRAARRRAPRQGRKK